MKTVRVGVLLLISILIFSLVGCNMPSPSAMPPLIITLHPASTTIYYGGCDPHTLQVDATLGGDTHDVAVVNIHWEVSNAPLLGLTGATGSGEVPMTRTGSNMYTYSLDMSGGLAIGAIPLTLSVYVRVISSSGTILASSHLDGLRWTYCGPQPGQTLILGQEWPLNVYYGLCITHDALEAAGFWAIVYDPTGVVHNVDVASTLERASDGTTVLTIPTLALMATGDVTLDGGVVYSARLDLDSLNPGPLLGGGDGRLRWSVRGLDSSGTLVSQYGIGLTSVHPCGPGNAGGEHLVAVTGTPPLPAFQLVTGTPTLPVLQLVTNIPTPTVQGTPQVTFTSNANCRKGPGSAYDVATSFLKGKTLDAVGRNEAGSWLLVQIQLGSNCWVADSTVSKIGLVEQLAIVNAPPLPEAPSEFVNSNICDTKLKTLTVSLNWGTVASASGFNLYRNGSMLASLDSGTTYSDSAPLGVDLTYAVEAVNAYGHSDQATTNVPACK